LGPKTGNNLMAWKMNTYESSTGGSATDADIDIAAALLIAYQKTGNSTYKDEALLIAKSIWEWEVSTSTKLLLPAMNNEVLGDGHLYNISYMSLAALKMFAAFDSDHDWNSVLDATLAYLQKVQDAGDGLWPDWSDPDGAPIDPDNNSNQSLKGKNGTTNSYEAFQKEAVRIPWRIAWYYSWFGDERAKALLDKAQAFIASQGKDTPNSLNAWYAYSGGNMASGLASTYMWASYCAFAMGSASNQDWLNACNERLLDATIPKNGYYNASLQLMYNLLFNGFYKF
jgi:endo-1,4-beta-D-glucanase Y